MRDTRLVKSLDAVERTFKKVESARAKFKGRPGEVDRLTKLLRLLESDAGFAAMHTLALGGNEGNAPIRKKVDMGPEDFDILNYPEKMRKPVKRSK